MRKIARRLEISLASVSRLCARWGLSRLRPPAEPVIRYEREHPGDLLHMDTKKLVCIGGPGSGREVVHVAIDDHSRIGFVQIYPDETKFSAIAFLEAAVKFYRGKGIRIRRLLTDNGSAYCSADFLAACEEHGIAKKFTRPYRPQTNGKAERFIQTCLREWIRPRRYATNKDRAKALKPWLKFYNYERPHSALDDQTPMSRLVNNVLKHNIYVFSQPLDAIKFRHSSLRCP
jgi:transposase InsO family protein